MIGASKILTVSYGTFSCTLEGFDDPFNTMRAIAEYFRDLAAEDRYFGAEPPTPDAAMLHRIAEREIHRRVEAKIQDNGVILRAEGSTTPSLTQPAPVAPPPSVMPAQQAEAVAESVAAKLSRLRAATPPADDVEDEAPSAPVEEALAQLMAEPVEPAEPAAPAPVAQAPIAPAPIAKPVAAKTPTPPKAPAAKAQEAAQPVAPPVVAAPVVEPVAEPEPAIVAHTEPAPAPEAVADTALPVAEPVAQQIHQPVLSPAPQAEPVRAAVVNALPDDLAALLTDDEAMALSAALGEDIAPAAIEDAPVENIATAEPVDAELMADILVEDSSAEDDADLAAALADIMPAVPAKADADLVAEAAEFVPEQLIDDAEPEADPTAAVLAALTADVTVPAPKVTQPEVMTIATEGPAPAAPSDAEVDLAALISTLSGGPTAQDAPHDPAASAEEQPATLIVDADAIAMDRVAEDLAAVFDAEPEGAEPAPAAPEKLQRARARVIKIRRADVSAAVAEVTAPEPAPVEEPRKRLEGQADETAVTRLIAQTNSEMEGPEAKRRLSAISHLKAAVAATVAERLSRGKSTATNEAARAEPYRDDLARAVRPRRPEGANAPERPAPLVLVSEQRIDRPVPQPAPVAAPPVAAELPAAPAAPAASPVRPRRVSSAAQPAYVEDDEDELEDPDNIFTDTRGFVEFADRLGVRSLPDLMEAAAAYTAQVEGNPNFSRPHLIRHLTAARGNDLPREDSLRAFGRLLREGRIEKVKRGQFAVSPTSRFLAEARKIDG